MFRLTGTFEERNGRAVIDLGDTTLWDAMPANGDAHYAFLLFGDEEAGPYLTMVHVPARTDPLPRFPPHGHATDSWRLAVQGNLSMASRVYQPGEFRFQQGHVPYGADDFAWGPEGGMSVLIMGDRRGSAMILADKSVSSATAASRDFYDWIGMAVPVDPGDPPGVATSIGAPVRGGRVEGSFAATEAWDEVEPGVRVAVGALGRPDIGPVVVLSRADAGATAFPAWPLETEVVHVVVAGSLLLGDDRADRGQIRAARAATPAVAGIAGAEGACVATILGDRSRLGDADAGPWSELVARVVAVAREDRVGIG